MNLDAIVDPNSAEGFARQLSSTPVIDKGALEGKELTPEQDSAIWGTYAKEFQTMFSSDDWRIVSVFRIKTQAPLDLCSHLMVQTYRRNIPTVEAYLEEYPSNRPVWQLYAWMLSIVNQTRAKALFDRIVPSPDTDWPIADACGLVVSEERAKGNWGFIAEMLLKTWPQNRNFVSVLGSTYNDYSPPTIESQAGIVEAMWRDRVSPFLESLINTNRTDEAEDVLAATAKFRIFRDFQEKAASLALSLGRQEVHDKWLALKIPPKAKSDINDLLDWLYSEPLTSPLILARSSTIEEPEYWKNVRAVDAIIKRPRLIDWLLSIQPLDPSLSTLLQRREGWPEGETHWVLIHDNKIFANGPGIPSEEVLYKALEDFRIPTPASVLRRFVADNPGNYEAKEALLNELKRIAEQKTKDALGEKAGVDAAAMLPDSDDHKIWFEYAALYRQLLPYFLERFQPAELWRDIPFNSSLLMHSRIMKTLAHSLLLQVEAAMERQPTNVFLWSAWVTLSNLVDYRSFKDVKDRLALSPVDDPLDLPPFTPKLELLSNYFKGSNWKGIIEILEWRWEAVQADSSQILPSNQERFSRDVPYLLEAYLRLDREREAKDFVDLLSQTSIWQQMRKPVIDLAKKCGKDALAEQWGRM